MIIDRNLTPYIVRSDETIAAAVAKIAEHRQSIICCVDEHGVLEGIFTNGDFLRWLHGQRAVNLDQSVTEILNRNFRSAAPDASKDKIDALLEQVLYVPLVNERGRLIAVARRRSKAVTIGKVTLDEESPAFVIAEIGINHNGSLELAKKLIDAAADAGADCAKFQMRDLSALYANKGNADDFSENLGSQYTLDLLARSQLTVEEMYKAFDHCRGREIVPLCTPWDLPSVEALSSYGVQAYKVASADLTYHDLIKAVAETGMPLICSTGMSYEWEIEEAVRLLQGFGAQYVLLNCNSTYPAPFKDVHLRYMERLAQIGDCLVGYSGHERGYAVPIAAVARGAKVIEKHITLDRTMEGNDHKVSLLPDEFQAMIEGIRAVEEALGTGAARQVSQGERMNRTTLAKSLIINCDLEAGEVISDDMISVKSPGRGLQPNRRHELAGKLAQRKFNIGDYFFESDLVQVVSGPRSYKFRRPWGLPVRFHDALALAVLSNPDFLEFHLSYKDMELRVADFMTEPMDLDLTVHSPDLFTGDHLLDLAAEDPAYRARSVAELQRVIDMTRTLVPLFKRATRPYVIVSMGGFSRDAALDRKQRPVMYKRIAESLSRLDTEGVELIAQTLPPFPWYFGGQLFLNLFVDPDDTAEFCATYGYRLCFDVSHSRLACNHFRWSFSEFVDTIGPHIAHLHIADALRLDGEGVQVGEGDIDFPALAVQLDRLAPDASFIPEIWQGHENSGEGFWVALNRLQKWY